MFALHNATFPPSRRPAARTRRTWFHRLLTVATTVVLLFVLGTTQASAQLQANRDFSKGGRAALQFLKIGLGARQAALGEASIASVRDVNAVFWNPAGLAAVESFQTSFSYVSWIADLNYIAGAAAVRWKHVGVVGLSIATLDYGDIPEALVTNQSGSNDTRTGNSFSGDDLLLTLSLSHEFTDRLAIGISAKMARESLFDVSESIFLFDVGTNYDLRFNGIRLAMSAQNFGSNVKFLKETTRVEGYDIPVIFRIGLSGDLLSASDAFLSAGAEHRLTVSLEAISTNDFSERFHVGAEYWFEDLIALRGGYRFNYAEGNLSAGFGLKSRASNVGFRLDYAYVDYEFLDSPHRLSLTLDL